MLSLALLSLGACASGVGAGGSQSPVGCYQFSPAAGLGLPWGVEIVDAPLEGWPAVVEGRTARTFLTPTQVADHPFAFWTEASGDSIRIAYPAGGSTTLIVVATDTGLSGRGVSAGDAVPLNAQPPSTARAVSAQRVACPVL